MRTFSTKGVGVAIPREMKTDWMGLPLVMGLLFMAFVLVTPVRAQELASDVETEVVGLAQTFLSALSGADTDTLASLLAPEAMIYSVRDGSEGPSLRAVTRTAFLEGLGGEDQDLLERMWDPTVMVQGRVAMVWAPYDFHLNGEFSHCGIDIFTMLKADEGWQVASITYNVVREGCPPSPLGPPGRSGG